MADFDAVLKAFAPIAADKRKNGGEVLTRLFKEYPGTQQLFPRFAAIPEGQLAGNAAVAEHGETVLNKLDDVLNRREKFADTLRPLADTHVNQHKIDLSHFNSITAVLMCMMKEQGSDAKGVDEFKKVMDMVISKMAQLYTELKKK